MFDTYIKRTTTAAAYPQTIHEHRAPTDDSVRLLNEMQQKAKDNIVTNIVVEDNILNGVICVMHNYIGYSVVFKFNLNGLDIVIEEDFKYNPLENRKKLLERFYEEFSKRVTEELMKVNISEFTEL